MNLNWDDMFRDCYKSKQSIPNYYGHRWSGLFKDNLINESSEMLIGHTPDDDPYRWFYDGTTFPEHLEALFGVDRSYINKSLKIYLNKKFNLTIHSIV